MRRTNNERTTNKQLPNYRASPDFMFDLIFDFGLIWSLAITEVFVEQPLTLPGSANKQRMRITYLQSLYRHKEGEGGLVVVEPTYATLPNFFSFSVSARGYFARQC